LCCNCNFWTTFDCCDGVLQGNIQPIAILSHSLFPHMLFTCQLLFFATLIRSLCITTIMTSKSWAIWITSLALFMLEGHKRIVILFVDLLFIATSCTFNFTPFIWIQIKKICFNLFHLGFQLVIVNSTCSSWSLWSCMLLDYLWSTTALEKVMCLTLI
jgi:hypothetical protein